ncbi:hypothetical protein Tco_0607544, partial [Tanacetum coccineum]
MWTTTSWQLANASLPRGRSNASKIADTRLRVRVEKLPEVTWQTPVGGSENIQ